MASAWGWSRPAASSSRAASQGIVMPLWQVSSRQDTRVGRESASELAVRSQLQFALDEDRECLAECFAAASLREFRGFRGLRGARGLS